MEAQTRGRGGGGTVPNPQLDKSWRSWLLSPKVRVGGQLEELGDPDKEAEQNKGPEQERADVREATGSLLPGEFM